MKKKDLRTGMRVECANNNIYIVILGDFTFLGKNVKEGLLLNGNGHIKLSTYDDNLNKIEYNKYITNYNINKVYDKPNVISRMLDINYKGDLLWERKETLVFKDFIIEQGINWNTFLLNCEVENQRWENKEEYNNEGKNYYTTFKPKDWLYHCFNWEYSLVADDCTLVYINDKWLKLVREHKSEIIFE